MLMSIITDRVGAEVGAVVCGGQKVTTLSSVKESVDNLGWPLNEREGLLLNPVQACTLAIQNKYVNTGKHSCQFICTLCVRKVERTMACLSISKISKYLY